MSRFIMLDHSLKEVGGHHYEYALNVLHAAEEAGLDIVMATNIDCQSLADFPRDWQVIPAFQLSAYSDYSASRGFGDQSHNREALLSRPISPWRRAWNKVCDVCDPRNLHRPFRRAARERRRYVRDRWPVVAEYSRECRRLFERIKWERDDTVFIPTLTEFDLERLVCFLSSEPATRNASWHLQFHFNYLDGREPDYLGQTSRFEAMQSCFHELLQQVPRHKIFLYATTEQLARQYDYLRATHFQPLAYPVNESLCPAPRERSLAALRVTTAGCIRIEKGWLHFEPLIRELWEDFFQSGRLQLVVQSDQKDVTLQLPDGAQPPLTAFVSEIDQLAAPVVGIRAPLPVEEYVSLIQATDIGLFLYDSERYYSRCSGVLVEMLAAGVPVIVPAGCWLSEQIAEAVYEYRDQLVKNVPAVQATSLREARIVSASGENVNCMAELSVPDSATHLLVVVGLAQPWPPGEYVRVTAEAMDEESRPGKTFSEILGSRADGKAPSAMIPLSANSTRLRLSLTNAYGSGDLLAIADAQFYFFSDSSVPHGIPLGSVGLIAEGPEQIADLLKDMTTHYNHYRDSAHEFSRQWRHEHHPQRTVEALLENGRLPLGKATCFARNVA